MSSMTFRRLLPLVAAALGFAATAPAFASDPSALYQCRVVLDRSACLSLPPQEMRDLGVEQVPGAYGLYLVHLGHSVDDAIVMARSLGEEPTLRRTAPMKQLSSAEAYQRLLGL